MTQLLSMSVGPAELAALLEGRFEFEAPAKVLAGISAADALREVPGLPYTIATLLSHLQWWQQRRIEVAEGSFELTPSFENGVTDWQPVAAENWDALVERYLAGIERLKELAADSAKQRRVEFEDRSVGFIMVSQTLHDAYHLGQIVMLRRLLGIWP